MTEYKELAARLRHGVRYLPKMTTDQAEVDAFTALGDRIVANEGDVHMANLTMSQAASAIEALEAELADFRTATATPEAIHANMLRGGFPILSIRQALHLHGEDALKRWDSIEALEAERDEARNNTWPFGRRPNPVVGHTYGDFAVYGDEKSIKRVREALHEFDAMMPARIERIHKEQASRLAAEARCKRLEEALREAEAVIDLGLDLISYGKGWGTYPRMEGVEIYEDADKFEKAAEAYRARLALQENTNGG